MTKLILLVYVLRMPFKKFLLRIGSISMLLTLLYSCSSETPITQTKDDDVKEIDWQTCDGKDAPEAPFECGFVDAPVDYRHPEGDKISIALIRLPTEDSETREGVILTNPGGPGGSGFDFRSEPIVNYVLGVVAFMSLRFRVQDLINLAMNKFLGTSV